MTILEGHFPSGRTDHAVSPKVLARIVRLRLARQTTYGEDLARLASDLGISTAVWNRHERGMLMPEEVMRNFAVLTGRSIQWLTTGDGDPSNVERASQAFSR